MKICKRCGVDFDGVGTWCSDCLDVEPVESHPTRTVAGFVRTNRLGGYTKEIAEHVWAEIRRLHGMGWTDRQIAEAVGVSDRTVLRRRQAYGLAANKTSPRESWRNPEEAFRNNNQALQAGAARYREQQRTKGTAA